MSRILIAWELGANYGHLISGLGVAQALRERGHTVAFAVRDTRAATELLSPAGFAFVQAPLSARKTRLSRPPANFSEILLGEGYADPLGLLGQVRAWRSLLELIGPDVIVAEYAPTAMLAAQSVGVPCVALANGFSVPPPVSPLPSIRPWEKIPASRLAYADKAVEASISEVMKSVGSKHSPKLVELYQNALLCVFPELDPFAPREGADYIGPISSLPQAITVKWTENSRRRILAYLRPEVAGFSSLMEALSAVDADKLCVIPGLQHEQASRLCNDRLRISTAPIAFDGLLNGADAFVSYGGSGSICQALRAGVPIVIVPCFIEQYLTAKRAEGIGTAVVVETNRSRENFDQALAEVLGDERYRSNARIFAERYVNFDTSQAIERAASAIEMAAGQRNISGRVMNG